MNVENVIMMSTYINLRDIDHYSFSVILLAGELNSDPDGASRASNNLRLVDPNDLNCFLYIEMRLYVHCPVTETIARNATDRKAFKGSFTETTSFFLINFFNKIYTIKFQTRI